MVKGDRLAGRTALITGGSRGIGFHIASRFLAEGADVVISATNAGKLASARGDLAAQGGRVLAEVADVSDRAACFDLIARTRSHLGGLDILVNCAGAYLPKPFTEYTHEEFSHIQNVNLHGPFHLMQAVLPGMVEAGYGKIVNVASTAGKWASKNQSAYNASKHALVGLTRCVAVETARKGITVNALCPGMVNTDMADDFVAGHAVIAETTPEAVREGLNSRIAMGRFLEPTEIAHLAVYLASSESDGMTGQSILLDGGMLFV